MYSVRGINQLSLSRRKGGPGTEGAAGISMAFRGRGHGILTYRAKGTSDDPVHGFHAVLLDLCGEGAPGPIQY